MKLYGIKMDKNEKGEEVALLELTRNEISNLMYCANSSYLYEENTGHELTARLSAEIFQTLYKIKYSNLWKK